MCAGRKKFGKMMMALLAAGGATTTISALGNCVVPRQHAVRLEFRHSGLRRLSFAEPVYRLRIAAPYFGARESSSKPRNKLVCIAAAAAAAAATTVESDANVKTALPTIPSEATLAKV